MNFGFFQATSAPRWPGVHAFDSSQYDAEIQRHLLNQTLVDVLGQMVQLGTVSGTSCEIIRLMADGQWRTRQMIEETLGITTAALYLPRFSRSGPVHFTGALVMRKVGRRCWYRRNDTFSRADSKAG